MKKKRFNVHHTICMVYDKDKNYIPERVSAYDDLLYTCLWLFKGQITLFSE